MFVGQFDAEHGAGEDGDDFAFDFDGVLRGRFRSAGGTGNGRIHA